jgi:Permuted papain-like amidase enzyme, YaeF/YiiX, C92 family
MKKLFILLLVAMISVVTAHEPLPLSALSAADLRSKMNSDSKAFGVYRDGLQDVANYIEKNRLLFPLAAPTKPKLLTESEKADFRAVWQRTSDYFLALESIEEFYADAGKLKGADKDEAVALSYAAFAAKYAYALKFIAAFERVPDASKILNEALPSIGLQKNSYAEFKFHYLHIKIASEFAARNTVYSANVKAPAALAATIAEDTKAIWKAGQGEGQKLTLQNSLDIIKSGGHTVWFPVQAGVSEWMGDAKVRRVNRSLISPAQISALIPRMLPGDILLERREWYISNIGLPGFWPHGAIYIGTPEERRAFFNDSEVQAWVKRQGQADGDFEALLSKKYGAAYELSMVVQHEHAPRVIEAVSEGVVFSTFEHTADADALAVLRPRLSKAEKASAILRAFQYSGRPYDFDFDFQTDAALVCTELVYKSYEPKPPIQGLKLPTVELVGRLAMPANLFAKQFDEDFGKPSAQFDLVSFLDGREKQGVAVEATVDEFRKSWQRPKWHIFVQEAAKK